MKPSDLFTRHADNPILTAHMWPYPCHSVFNPGAVRLQDGTTLLLVRVEDFRGFSHLTVARSVNGVDAWQIDPEPTFAPDPEVNGERWGLEDPRITYVPELEEYVVTYTAFGPGGPSVAIARTKDFKTFERLGIVMPPDDKDAALFPRKFEQGYALIHRPVSRDLAHIWISFSPDLKNWGSSQMMLKARSGPWWDANKIGLSPPPIETKRGWLMLYHGVRKHASGSIYRTGLALFDLHDPCKCLLRGEPWAIEPSALYEREGDVPYVVFPCGTTLQDDGDTLRMYCGAADQVVTMMETKVSDCLNWLDHYGREPMMDTEEMPS